MLSALQVCCLKLHSWIKKKILQESFKIQGNLDLLGYFTEGCKNIISLYYVVTAFPGFVSSLMLPCIVQLVV